MCSLFTTIFGLMPGKNFKNSLSKTNLEIYFSAMHLGIYTTFQYV